MSQGGDWALCGDDYLADVVICVREEATKNLLLSNEAQNPLELWAGVTQTEVCKLNVEKPKWPGSFFLCCEVNTAFQRHRQKRAHPFEGGRGVPLRQCW